MKGDINETNLNYFNEKSTGKSKENSYLDNKLILQQFEPINIELRKLDNVLSDNYYDNILNECYIDAANELIEDEK